MMGAVLQTVNIRLSPQQILYTLNHAGADVLLCHTDFLPILDALKETSFVGAETEMVSEFFFAASRVPGLKVDRFHFTGKSDH